MRLISVKTHNFRQYKDLELTFPKNGSYDIHILEASNGVGKTNFLNAINWCLYGDEPHKSGIFQRDDIHETKVDSNSLPLYNIEVMQELKETGASFCLVKVIVELDIDGEKYTFTREQSFKVDNGVPFGQEKRTCSRLTSFGNTEFLQEDDIYTKLQTVLPKDIREYFYFDGEQLLTYFRDSKRRNVRDNVYTIAQINILDTVKKHLKSTKDYYKNEYLKKDPKLSDKETELNSAKENREALKLKLDQTVSELKKAEKELAIINSDINGQEFISVYNNNYNDKKKLLQSYEEDLSRLYSERDRFIRDSIINILLYHNNKSVTEYINNRQEEDDAFTDLRDTDIEESIANCECKLCKQKLDKTKLQVLKFLLEKIKGNSSMKKIAELAPLIRNSLDINDFTSRKNTLLKSIEDKNYAIEGITKEIDELDVKLKEFGSNAVANIAELIQKRKDYETLLEKKKKEQHNFSSQLEDVKNQVAKLEIEYKKALNLAAEQESSKKYWEFASESYDVLNKVINDLAETGRNRIAERTEKLFGELIWKKDTYGRVELAEDYSLKLYHKYNNKSCLDSCSASETELLALAFTLAVHEVSGYDSFLLIDTPVGRVSDTNRKNFAEVLLKISTEKQIILEVTPSEYSDEIKDVLSQPELSSYARLYLKNNCVFKEN